MEGYKEENNAAGFSASFTDDEETEIFHDTPSFDLTDSELEVAVLDADDADASDSLLEDTLVEKEYCIINGHEAVSVGDDQVQRNAIFVINLTRLHPSLTSFR